MKKKRCIIILVLVVAIVSYFGLALWIKIEIEEKYNNAIAQLGEGNYQEAIIILSELGNYKDALEKLSEAKSLEEKLAEYDRADDLLSNKQYMEAYKAFSDLGDYNDSKNKAQKCLGLYGDELLDKERYIEAISIFQQLRDISNNELISTEPLYTCAVKLFNSSDYENATVLFQAIEEYKDSKLYVAKISLALHEQYQKELFDEACRLFEMGEYRQAIEEIEQISDYPGSEELKAKCEEALRRKELANTIAAGVQYAVGIRTDGTIVSTTDNDPEWATEQGLDFSQWSDIVSVASYGIAGVGIKADGSAVSTGKVPGANLDVSEWAHIVEVSAGEQFFVGLTADGHVLGVGHNGDEQINLADWTGIVRIATGWRHTVGLDAEGKVRYTGFGNYSGLEEWKDIISVAAGGGIEKKIDGKIIDPGNGHIVGLKKDGTVVAVGDNTYNQCEVGDWTGIIAIAAGEWHTVGLRYDGTVVSTRPDPEKFAEENPDIEKFPIDYLGACDVDDWDKIVAISAGTGFTVGLKEDGSVVTAGYNDTNRRKEAAKWTDIMVYKEDWERARQEIVSNWDEDS